MTCSRCSRDVEVDSTYCRFCGAPVREGQSPRPLKRLPDEGRIAGVCAGIASYLDADPTLVRLAWVALSIVPGVLIGGLLGYVVAWLFLPEGQRENAGYSGKTLLRSTRDRTVGGVCGGIAEYLGVDSTMVRVLWVVLSIYPGAVIGGVLAYVIAWLVIPDRRESLQPATTSA